MPAFPRTKPLPHILLACYPTTYAASPVTACCPQSSLHFFSLYPQHISICKPHLNIAVIHVINTFHDIIHSIIFHIINPSFPLSCPIRPVIPPYLLFCTLLFLYLTNNRINLLCTGISLHTLQIINLFLQQLCPITHILNLALVKLHII